ncbi:MAG: type II secretion system F family protein [Nitrospirae bacterium]|nr:MAG: type II secretion system F family protein [Nitrospirota bacterium]
MEAPVLISILVFLLTMVLLLGLASYLRLLQVRRLWTERLEGKQSGNLLEQLRDTVDPIKTFVSVVMTKFGTLTSTQQDARLPNLRPLVTAGYRNPKAVMILAGTKFVLALALPLCMLLFRPDSVRLWTPAASILLYVALAMVGYYAPQLWLHLRIRERKRRISEGFPDALDLIVVCLESGLGLGPAIQRVGEEIKLAHKQLSDELHVLSFELRTGLPRQQALRNLGIRTGVDDVKSLMAVLIQTDRFGTSVGDALRVYSDHMRKTRQFRAEELANKLPIKLLFPLIFCIFPSFFVILMGPAVITLMRVLLPALGNN